MPESKPSAETPAPPRAGFDLVDVVIALGLLLVAVGVWMTHHGAGVAVLGAELVFVGARSLPAEASAPTPAAAAAAPETEG